MAWPWVRRSKLNAYRTRFRDALDRLGEADRRSLAAEAAREVLAEQLAKSEQERTAVTLKMLRLLSGINPFAEEYQQPASQDAPATPAEPTRQIGPDLSPEQVRLAFTEQAVAMYPNDLRKISRYVEQQQQAYYAHRDRPSVLTPAEEREARRVAEQMRADLLEGLEAQGTEKE